MLKICSVCKSENSDNAKYCHSCGSARFQTNEQESLGYFQPSSSSESTKVLSSNPTIHILKKIGTAKLFLAAIGCMAMLVLINIVNGIYQSFSQGNAGSLLTTLLACVPQILLSIGLSMFYATCRSKEDSINPFCFKLLRVTTIIFIFFYILLYILELIALVELTADFSYFLGIIITAVLMMIYFTKSRKALKAIENMVNTGYPEDCIPMYFIVMSYLIALASVFNIVSYGLIGVFLTMFEIAFLVLFSISLYTLRKDIKNLIFKISINPDIEKDCTKPGENLNSVL